MIPSRLFPISARSERRGATTVGNLALILNIAFRLLPLFRLNDDKIVYYFATTTINVIAAHLCHHVFPETYSFSGCTDTEIILCTHVYYNSIISIPISFIDDRRIWRTSCLSNECKRGNSLKWCTFSVTLCHRLWIVFLHRIRVFIYSYTSTYFHVIKPFE